MTRPLFTGGTIRRLPAAATAEWLLVEGGRVRAVGIDAAARWPIGSIDLDGGWLLPAFCDGHVHLPVTGLYASGSTSAARLSADAILDALQGAGPTPAASMVFGGNFEEPLDRPLIPARLRCGGRGSPVHCWRGPTCTRASSRLPCLIGSTSRGSRVWIGPTTGPPQVSSARKRRQRHGPGSTAT